MNEIPKTHELFDLTHTLSAALLEKCEYPFEAIPKIGDFIRSLFPTLDDSYEQISEGVYVAKDAKIWDGVTIVAPTIIGHRTEIRPGAFIRGNVLVGDDAVIGNSTELKNAIIFDRAQLPHYNYVGDSIIGYKAHMSAGAIASNLRLDKEKIFVEGVATGLTKFGLCLGDAAEVGCSAVLCPGTIIGKRTLVYPLVMVRGVLPAEKVYDGHTLKDRRPDNGTTFWN